MKLLFTGDVNFRGKGKLTWEESKQILTEVQPWLDLADFRIPNLETPLADKEKHNPIKKSGPNLISAPENIVFLQALGADAVTLANNHIGDYGEGAAADTVALLDQKGMLHAGAGKNIETAYKAFRLEKEDISVSVLSVCENEFGMAEENAWGSAGYDPRRLFSCIRQEKEKSDCVIVVFHGGNEFNPLPSPDTMERYRLICDMGADAVIAGHTHCPQGYEIYDGKPIVYSMGNFLFQSSSPKVPGDSWHYGYMTMLTLGNSVRAELEGENIVRENTVQENTAGITLQVIPYKFNPKATTITVFVGEEKNQMMEYLDKLSKIMQNPGELSSYFMGWAWNHKWCPILPPTFLDFAANTPDWYHPSGSYNLAKCEAHYSQLKEVMRIFHAEQEEEAKVWAEKITELQKMPV